MHVEGARLWRLKKQRRCTQTSDWFPGEEFRPRPVDNPCFALQQHQWRIWTSVFRVKLLRNRRARTAIQWSFWNKGIKEGHLTLQDWSPLQAFWKVEVGGTWPGAGATCGVHGYYGPNSCSLRLCLGTVLQHSCLFLFSSRIQENEAKVEIFDFGGGTESRNPAPDLHVSGHTSSPFVLQGLETTSEIRENGSYFPFILFF